MRKYVLFVVQRATVSQWTTLTRCRLTWVMWGRRCPQSRKREGALELDSAEEEEVTITVSVDGNEGEDPDYYLIQVIESQVLVRDFLTSADVFEMYTRNCGFFSMKTEEKVKSEPLPKWPN